MEEHFIETLPGEAKKWFASAVAGMIVADGQVTDHELVHLKHTIRFLDNMEDVNQIVSKIKCKERIELGYLKKIERSAVIRILLELATIAISDDALSNSEADYFKYAGSKLGFEARFCEKVLKWGVEALRVNRTRKDIIKEAQKIEPVYQNM